MKNKQINDCNYRKKSNFLHFVDFCLCRNRGIVFFIVVFCLFILNQSFLLANEREVVTFENTVPVLQKLTFENRKSFPEISAEDFHKGYVELKDAVTLSVSSNIPWKVVVFTNQINLYKTRGEFKSVENFQWRVNSNKFQSISRDEKVIKEGEGGIRDHKIKIDYRMKVGWKDTPPGKWEFKPEFRILPDFGKRKIYQEKKYTDNQMFSTRSNVIFPLPTAEDLDKGYIDSKYNFRLSDLFHQIKSANKSVSNIFITCEQPYFTPYKLKKSHQDLLWKLHNEPESKFRPIDFQMANIHSNGSLQNVELDFRLMLDWEDMPGKYSFESIFILETKKIKQIYKEKKDNQPAFE